MNIINQVPQLHSCWYTKDGIFYLTLTRAGEKPTVVAIMTDIYFKATVLGYQHITQKARAKRFMRPHPLLTSWLRSVLSPEDIYSMSLLRIVVMHNPLPNGIKQTSKSVLLLQQKHVDADFVWEQETGFVFIDPRT
jgi:hypothetical protein